jgi:hypothetical protein
VCHGGRDLPPCRSAAGSLRHVVPPFRQKQAPAAVGYDARCTYLEIFYSTIYFLKIEANKYKKFKLMAARWEYLISEFDSPLGFGLPGLFQELHSASLCFSIILLRFR